MVDEYASPDDYSTEERVTDEPNSFAWINLIGIALLVFGVPAVF